jgi:hypothetical protein
MPKKTNTNEQIIVNWKKSRETREVKEDFGTVHPQTFDLQEELQESEEWHRFNKPNLDDLI